MVFSMFFWLLKKHLNFLQKKKKYFLKCRTSKISDLNAIVSLIHLCLIITRHKRIQDFRISFWGISQRETKDFYDWFPVKLVHCDIVSKSSISRVLDILFDLDKAPNQPLKTEPASQRPSSSANVIIISTSNQVISLLTLMTSQSMARTQKSPKVKLIR